MCSSFLSFSLASLLRHLSAEIAFTVIGMAQAATAVAAASYGGDSEPSTPQYPEAESQTMRKRQDGNRHGNYGERLIIRRQIRR